MDDAAVPEAAVGADFSDAEWTACVSTAEVAWQCFFAVNDDVGDGDVTAVEDDIAEGGRFWVTLVSG